MPEPVPVAAGVIIRNGKIFIARRSGSQDPLAGTWEFPGGKIRPGESPQECLKRELLEELNIEVAVEEFVTECTYFYPHVSIKLMAYKCFWKSGEIRLIDHGDFAWVTPEELLNFNLSPADRIIAKRIFKK
jgi:8-oxo-dGTP diphosphatase